MNATEKLIIVVAGKQIETTQEIWKAFLNLSGLVIDTGDLFAYDDVFSKETLLNVQSLKNELAG
jgi:hypothetical protein